MPTAERAGPPEPSPLLLAWRHALCEAAAASPGGPVLDVACGRGRNALAVAAWGPPVLGLDRSAEALADLRDRARRARLPVTGVRCDLEAGLEMPVAPASCAVILVFRFLFRPLAPALAEALAPGGLLLYETFTRDQRRLAGGPRSESFLLREGELPGLFPGLDVLARDEGRRREGDRVHALASLVARRPRASG